MAMQKYHKGQVWRYRTRAGEEASRLYIVQEDKLGGSTVFHVFVDSVCLANPYVQGGIQTSLPHACLTEVALDTSVIALDQHQSQWPATNEGYEAWSEAFEKGGAGALNISIAEVLDRIEDMVFGHKSA